MCAWRRWKSLRYGWRGHSKGHQAARMEVVVGRLAEVQELVAGRDLVYSRKKE